MLQFLGPSGSCVRVVADGRVRITAPLDALGGARACGCCVLDALGGARVGLVTLKGWLVCLGGRLVRLLGLRGLGLLGLGACGLRGFMGLACEPWPLVVCARSGRH